MTYSAWNVGTGQFDYFEDGQPQGKLNAPKPGHLRSRTLGATVDQAAWPLPASARYVGSGGAAVGRVASKKSASALGDLSTDDPLVKAALLVGIAYLAWRYVVRAPRRRVA
jgi:hypothetical protein